MICVKASGNDRRAASWTIFPRAEEIMMSEFVKIEFSSLDDVKATTGSRGEETLVVFVSGELKLGETAAAILGAASGLIATAASAANFKGKAKSALDILAPTGLGFGRLLVVGTQAKGPAAGSDGVGLGGFVMGKLRDGAKATVVFDLPGAESTPQAAADFVQGVQLRAYRFDRYKTKKEETEKPGPTSVTVAVRSVDAVRKLAAVTGGIADGVELARTLVNEPPNVLFPIEFARRAAELSKLGVEIEILDLPALEKLGMRALLAVGQGSAHESRVVVMRWKGGTKDAKPVAFVGKGVCFDSGGISIKPAAGMEDMKGDMAGAACVVGLLHALAARKAKVDAIGGDRARREHAGRSRRNAPATSSPRCRARRSRSSTPTPKGGSCWPTCSGTCRSAFKPEFMIDLATLTGAILVASRGRTCRPVLEQRRSGRTAARRPGWRPARKCGGCRSGPPTTSSSIRSSPT